MRATELSVGTLIAEVEEATPDASPIERVRRAQLRAYTLAESGEQLVGHFVSRAKESGATWAAIGGALGVSRQAAQQSGRALFDRFTAHARSAVVQAEEAARAYGNHHIGTEHLLLGVLAITDGLGARILIDTAGSVAAVETAVEPNLSPAEHTPPPAKIPFTARSKEALGKAARTATELSQDYVGTEHLLLGLFDTGGQADATLQALGMNTTAAREKVQTMS